MPDKGIEIVVALLEKRESILVTKDTSKSLAKELLRAESLGYAQKDGKAAVFTLSEKGRLLVNSGYNYVATENPEPRSIPSPTADNGLLPGVQAVSSVLNLEQQRELFMLRMLKAALFLLALLIICFIVVNLGDIQIW